MNLDTLAKRLHETARNKGFWDSFDENDPFIFYAKQLAMVHSEVTEVLEAIRKSKGELEVVTEMADIIIRILDLFEGLKLTGEISKDISLEKLLVEKSIVNSKRPQKHGVRG